MVEICNSLDFENQDSNEYVMKHGDEGDSFKLVIKGKVTVWIPMKMENMIGTIEELRTAVLDSISLIDYSDDPLFDLEVYFDPWKVDDDKETNYAAFRDYGDLIDQDLNVDDRIFLWNAYKIKRAIDMVRRFEDRYPSLFADGVLEKWSGWDIEAIQKLNEIIDERTNDNESKERCWLTVSKRRELELKQVSKDLGYTSLTVVEDSVFHDIRALQLEVNKTFLERSLQLQK